MDPQDLLVVATVFLLLKAGAVITWPWWVTLLPLWMYPGYCIAIVVASLLWFAMVAAVAAVVGVVRRRHRDEPELEPEPDQPEPDEPESIDVIQ